MSAVSIVVQDSMHRTPNLGDGTPNFWPTGTEPGMGLGKRYLRATLELGCILPIPPTLKPAATRADLTRARRAIGLNF